MKTPSKEEAKIFKVLVGYDKKNLLNMPNHIPWDMLNEEYAQLNHSQSLARLNERGGLCVTEMLANIQKQRSRDWTVTQATVDELNALVENYHLSLKESQSADVMTLEDEIISLKKSLMQITNYSSTGYKDIDSKRLKKVIEIANQALNTK